ncbi:MAG: redoxin domain-containing protein [Planctomycetota bacterium]|nr:redoxin domain-containing protein [Planctomycetota bacterium]
MSFFTTLALVAPLLAASPSSPARVPATLTYSPYADARFEALLAEYRAAEQALKQVGNWTSEARRDLVAAFNVRMRPLVDDGHGPATGWTLAHYAHDPLSNRAPEDVKRELWSRVLPAEAGAEWIWLPEIHNERSCAAASAMWRAELDRDPSGPLARAAERALWRIENLQIGRVVPTVCGVDVDGNELCVDDFRGKLVVLGFFSLERDSTVVEPLVALQHRFQSSPLTLIGVARDAHPNTFRKLADHRGVRFPTMFESGPQGRAMNSLRLDQPPSALILDAEGRLREVLTDPSQLESTVRSYLRDRPIAEGGAITNQ